MQQLRSGEIARIKKESFIIGAEDQARYVGKIDMDAIQKSFEDSFRKLAHNQGEVVDFERYDERCQDLITIVTTAHPTFLASLQEAGLLADLFTAIAKDDQEKVQELKAQVPEVQKEHPYKDPTTDEEGERLNQALKNTLNPARMMQRAQIKVAQELYPDQWKQGTYSPFNRNTWQKKDRDGRDIPENVSLGEDLSQRRLGFEWIWIPEIEALQNHPAFRDPNGEITNAIERMKRTAAIYDRKENALAALDNSNIDYDKLQEIADDLVASKEGRITHPKEIIATLQPILDDPNTPDDLFIETKMIADDLLSNGLCFATPTHRTNAEDAQKYLLVERYKEGKGDIYNGDDLGADETHFDETEEMIAKATDRVSGSFTDMLKKAPKDGGPVHQMMMIRRFVLDNIDSHTIEKIDIAETHNATTQRAIRLAAKQYGVSDYTDVGILHEDEKGIDPAHPIYSKLLKSKQYLEEISHHNGDTTKKRPRIVLKIGYSDFAKQHSSPGGKPSNEKCLLQTMKAIREAGLAGKIDLDIEFAGGEGAGRRVNPKGQEWTLKETVTPAVLSYAHKHGIRIKYRETIQGGDGCILLGTEESAAKVMSNQLAHLSEHLTSDPSIAYDKAYYKDLEGKVSEHHRAARNVYHDLYNDPSFAMMVKMFGAFCEKGGSRKVSRAEVRSPYDKVEDNQPPLADVRAIGYNARLMQMFAHLTPIYGQGTAFQQNQERTSELLKSDLFRERLLGAYMVRDLQMLDELEEFVELFNPETWAEFDEFDQIGQYTTEARIAQRLDNLVYSDGDQRRVYPRLKKVLRDIKRDLSAFDQVIKREEFNDIRAKIREGNAEYDTQVADKRSLMKDIQATRIDIMKGIFRELESSPVNGEHYSRAERHNAIHAGMCMDFGKAAILLGDATNDNSAVHKLMQVSSAVPHLLFKT